MALVSGGTTATAAASCATVRLAANATGLASASTVPFDTTLVDSDGYFDSVGHRFVIPAGKAGLFLVGASLNMFNTGAATFLTCVLNNTGADVNANAQSNNAGGGGAVTDATLLQLAVGNVLTVRVNFDVAATIDVSKSISSFWLIKIT
jgi:hypothetical protein